MTNEEGYFGNWGVDNGLNSKPDVLIYECLNDVNECAVEPNLHPLPPYIILTHVYRPLTTFVMTNFLSSEFSKLPFKVKTYLGRIPPYLIYCLGIALFILSNN